MPYDAKKHGPRRIVDTGFHAKVYKVVATIPSGWVATYGDVAGALGLRSVARQVGFALAALTDQHHDVPWHRVVNVRGDLSARSDSRSKLRQQELLEAEGIEFSESGRILKMDSVRFVLKAIAD